MNAFARAQSVYPMTGDALAGPHAPSPRIERTARLDVLVAGSLTATAGKVVSTCSLIRDEPRCIIVDPGMADEDEAILAPLRALGQRATDVTDVVLGHHHPDHTLRAGLFPQAAVHDHWATYRGSAWFDHDAEGRHLSRSVQLIRVPGHTAEDIAVVVGTDQDIAVLTHLWWHSGGPAEDPFAEDSASLHRSRKRVLAFATMIVPGHGSPFRVTESTLG